MHWSDDILKEFRGSLLGALINIFLSFINGLIFGGEDLGGSERRAHQENRECRQGYRRPEE
jgi:hypothetical protein